MQEQRTSHFLKQEQNQLGTGGGSGASAAPTPQLPTIPTPPASASQSPDADQQAEITRRITNAQGAQSTVLTGGDVDTTQGVQKKTILGS